MIGFNLHTGMTEKEILGELHGKVHGETEQEYQNFAGEKFSHIPNEQQLHEVVLSNHEYALMIKWNYYRINSKVIDFVKEYFLSGITDEGFYFVKQIDDFERRFTVMPSTIEEIVDNINRKDERFERVQGDVLCKYIDFHDIPFGDTEFMNWNRKHFMRIDFSYERNYSSGFFGLKKQDIGYKLTRHDVYGDWNLHVFTNHKLITDGKLFFQDNERWSFIPSMGNLEEIIQNAETVLIAKGTYFELKHNEHDKVKYEIPKGKVVQLMPQVHRAVNLD